MSNTDACLGLKPLFKKLGHHLEEIRVRALLNIESKLEHKLLCDADVVHEKHLLIRLLEWFNFPTCPHQDKVLGLLHRLAKNGPAASIILDVGGVEFLTNLRPNIDKELQPIVDSILDCLFHLPTVDDEVNAPECVYRHRIAGGSKVDITGTSSAFTRYSDLHQESRNISSSHHGQNLTTQTNHFAGPEFSHKQSPPEPKLGYFENQQQEPLPSSLPALTAKCFKFSTSPWVTLTPTDKHVLSSTDNSLRSNDRSLVLSALEFLSDVVFQDFPAEIFLQRPGIAKSLLSLLGVQLLGGGELSVQCVRTLQNLASRLEARIYYYQDPTLYSPKLVDFGGNTSRSSSAASMLSQSLASSDSRPSVIGRSSDPRHRGDGHDGSNISNMTNSSSTPLHNPDMGESTDSEDSHQLQFQQWTLPHFCVCALEKLVTLFKTEDETLITECIGLVHKLNTLLGHTVVAAELWEDNSLAARDLTDRLQDVLDGTVDVLLHHHQMNLAERTPETELTCHHVSYLGIALAATKTICSLIPVNQIGKAFTDSVSNIISFLCHDEFLATTFPSGRDSLLPYLRNLDSAVYDLYCTSQLVGSALKSTCRFMRVWQELVNDKVVECVELANECLPALSYSFYMPFIDAAVEMSSKICRKNSPNPTAVTQCRSMLVKLLSHPVRELRTCVYQASCATVKESLGVDHVTQPGSTASMGIIFLLDNSVLRQICCDGMTDSDKRVRAQAEDILLHLLQSQLLMPASRWQQLLEVFIPLLPILQGFVNLESTFGKCLLGMLPTDVTNATGVLPKLERLRGTLRLMFSNNIRIRSEAVGRLAWFMANEPESVNKQPQFSEIDVCGITDLFIVESPRTLVEEKSGTSVFKVDGLEKVLNIFLSETVEDDVRKSAAEQLSVMLHDSELHPSFKQLGGQKRVLELLKESVMKPSDYSKLNVLLLLIPSVLRMLRHLVQHDAGLRHKLAHDNSTYYTLLRCCLMQHKNKVMTQDVAEILMFLLFEDLAIAALSQRYKFPMKLPKIEPVTPFLSEADAQLLREPLLSVIKLSWNEAWYDDMDSLAAHCQRTINQRDQNNSFSNNLLLSTKDKMVICSTYIPSALQQCIYNIQNATSHDMVARAVKRLNFYLVIGQKNSFADELHELDWMVSLHRFFMIIPSSNADESLLTQLLQMTEAVLASDEKPPTKLFSWLSELLHHPQGALLNLMGRVEVGQDSLPDDTLACKRKLNRQMLRFVRSFVGKLPYVVTNAGTAAMETIRGIFTQRLLRKLNVTDATHFYNLASLEATLLCLTHVTARPGWSVGSSDADSLSLCLQLLQSLLEVVSAFHAGRGGVSMSYMGCGVTRSATICLRHLAFEMASQLQSKDWPRNWLFSRQATPDSVGESGLHWLTPLWTYRDPQVRAAGMGIAVALTMTDAGRITMTTQCQHIIGGPWGAAFSILLDQSECSMVRQQAALLLVNLTSQQFPNPESASGSDVLYGPVVRNEETEVSLTGLSALLALLHHSHFYQEVQAMLSMYYPQPAIHPVSVAGVASPITTPLGSQDTAMTLASGSFNGTFLGPGGQLVTSTPATREQISSGRPTPVGNYEQRDQAVGNPSSATSDTTLSGQEYQSVTTPCLISALCQLMVNLLNLSPQDMLISLNRESILPTLISMIDAKLLEAYVNELKTKPETRAQYLPAFHDLLQMQVAIQRLLQSCVVHDINIQGIILQEKQALKQLVLLLGVAFKDDEDSSKLCSRMWASVLETLTIFLQLGHQQTLIMATPVFVKTWHTIAARSAQVLQDTGYSDSTLQNRTLSFLSCLFVEEGKLLSMIGRGEVQIDYSVKDRLDMPPATDSEGSLLGGSSGAVICQALVKIYDGVSLRTQEQALSGKMLVTDALKCLLAVSFTAKVAALEGGLVETLCEHVKRLTAKINIESLKVSETAKKRDKPIFMELMMTFELLRNFMFNQLDVKVAAYECGLSDLLHRLWAWYQVEPVLMTSALQLLATYTARCPQACSSLAFTSSMALPTDKQVGVKQYSNNSLVHSLIKLALKETPATPMVFAVLATLALSPESRGIMCKNNFLDEFPKISKVKTKKVKAQKARESMWLDLLVNLSFSIDGQNMILKTADVVSILLEFGNEGGPKQKRCAILILHNLCFHTSNKPKLLANEKLLPFFLKNMEGGSEEIRTMCSSALLALVYNSQKAKVSMKNTHIICKLEDLFNQLLDSEEPTYLLEKCAHNLQDTLTLLRT